MRKVVVTVYDEGWPIEFEHAAEAICGMLGSKCLEVEHIGSTAVPGLAAKPVIDLLVIVSDIEALDQLEEEFRQLGYQAKGENGLPGRRYFERGGNARTHHVHCYGQGDPEILRHLAFRDFLKTNPQTAAAYGRLKLKLAKQYPLDIDQYIEEKQAMIQEIERKAMGEI
ncbi:GrpB family protein [Planococcus sp. CP5-4]|uniref:GrpB family protein n=1 Tax=unclassified Planococcus (in: firmicutes) TaxID=2662419 RepID=UPI001C229DA8|nr:MULTISPECIES: GrpB family protein [unclassified Planococcus (in: firmicutes)]MBU9672430.1 GrpB family protein [Planococcus sp. CP5-4_YE]MBV0909481.1 GrpB family protein [Planococcus sp. CP5-4_UN]MBW6064210.1 GrpB family protein [Planococcus sp. CP5-4]